LQWWSRLKISFCEIFGVVRFEDIWAGMRPFLSGPTATEKMMTSRSLALHSSMFLTRMGFVRLV